MSEHRHVQRIQSILQHITASSSSTSASLSTTSASTTTSALQSESLEKQYLNKHKQQLPKYIFLGGGTGGATAAYLTAKRLLAKQQQQEEDWVLLLEEGKDHPDKNRLSDWAQVVEGPHTFQFDTRTPDGARDRVPAVTHKQLGGCSNHDTRITFAWSREQADKLAATLNDRRWNSESMLRYEQELRAMMPLMSAETDQPDAVWKHVSLAGEQAGLATVQHYNVKPVCDSIGYPALAHDKDGYRWSPASLYSSSHQLSNLELSTAVLVDRIIFDQNKRAVAVVIIRGTRQQLQQQYTNNQSLPREVIHVHPDGGEIILTLGSIETAACLLRSGIGPAADLQAMNINIIHDDSLVGHGLDHPEFPISYEYINQAPLTGMTMGWPMVMFFGGDYMAHLGAAAYPYTKTGESALVITPNLKQPIYECGFQVKLASIDPRVSPIVIHKADESDINRLAAAGNFVRHLMSQPALQGWIGREISPGRDVVTVEQWREYVRRHRWTVYHWMSTCAMGRVIDSKLCVNGVKGLRVAAGAAVPMSEANPYFGIMCASVALSHMLAE